MEEKALPLICEEGRKLADAISQMYGISLTNVFEIAVRNYAKELGLWKGPEAP
jgi:hypothetical protein